MAELLLELYSEEIPPQLQIEARSQLKQFIENSFKESDDQKNSMRSLSGKLLGCDQRQTSVLKYWASTIVGDLTSNIVGGLTSNISKARNI